MATATKVHVSQKYGETSDNLSYFTRYYEKTGKKETFICTLIQLQGKTHYGHMDDIRQEIHNCHGRSFSILMLPGINSPKISNIYLGEFPYIDQCIRSLIMGLELAERVSDSLAR